MNIDPNVFKAYDVRGVYPGEVNEEAARGIGAAFVAYLGAKKVALGRDMRLSSPVLAGGVQITASHNPKQYNGMKMVRQEAFPLRGEEGLLEIRQMIEINDFPTT